MRHVLYFLLLDKRVNYIFAKFLKANSIKKRRFCISALLSGAKLYRGIGGGGGGLGIPQNTNHPDWQGNQNAKSNLFQLANNKQFITRSLVMYCISEAAGHHWFWQGN
jgi:hypothetical protein